MSVRDFSAVTAPRNGRAAPLSAAAIGFVRAMVMIGLAALFGAMIALAVNVALWDGAARAGLGAPGAWRWIAFGAAAGAVVSAGLMLILNREAEHIGGAADVERKSNFAALGAAPAITSGALRRLSPDARNGAGLVAAAPGSPYAAAFRDLLEHVRTLRRTHDVRVIALASLRTGQHGAVAALALARTAALAGERVLLIDCDTRERELTQLVCGEGTETPRAEGTHWLGAIVQDEATELDVLPLSASAPLRREHFAGALKAMTEVTAAKWDIVLLSCPPVLAGDEALLLNLADASILFVGLRPKPTLSRLRMAERRLRAAGAWTLGVFLMGGAPLNI